MAEQNQIEVVRGQLSRSRAAEIVEFWSAHGVLTGDAARQRLPEVVCLLRDAAGKIVGTNSAHRAKVPSIGNRWFWIYRRFLAPGVRDEAESPLTVAAFEALEREFEPSGDAPIGLCVLVDDPVVMRRHREAVWPESGFVYAGYAENRRQVRVRYFESSEHRRIATRDWSLPPEYRIEVFGESDAVRADDVLAFWARSGAVPADEAPRRIHEVLLVATHVGGAVVGASSVYLQRSARLRMDLWYSRGFVAAEHRMHNVMMQFGFRGAEVLEERFTSGRDTRASGLLAEVQNQGINRKFAEGISKPLNYVFIGENRRGDHVRVRYFRGALVPLPS